ncbi:phosphatase PAP2 family protein [Novosphingobium flavum]|uniref:Phosphatase PAP2 family protein n=2 Tax=Novosphingobium flavum TaxID=1778672 RepID=A0A7X1FSP4_9SPHN|nr:phosphatase PAP2 family protein [Novosphingobium flavum]
MIEHPSPKGRSAQLPSWPLAPTHAGLAALACWAGFALVSAMVLGGWSGSIDEAGLLFWRGGALLLPRGPVWLLEAVRDVTALGGVVLRSAFALAGVLALWRLARAAEARALALSIITGWAVEFALKLLVGRDRPVIVPHLTEAGGASFPSGHSFNAALVYLSLALAFAALSPSRAARAALIAAALALSFAIALSRVWLGVHFPTDALAGWLGGSAWAFTAAAIAHRRAMP